jgi:hypothetical protein
MCNKEQMFCQLAAFVARFLCFQTHGPTAHVTKSWAGLLAGGPRDQGGNRDARTSEYSADVTCETLPEAVLQGAGLQERRISSR